MVKVFILFLIPLSIFALMPSVPSLVSGQSQTVLQVWSQVYESSNIVDSSLTPQSTFVVDIIAFDLPPIVNNTSGGVNAYDITVNYDSTILHAEDVDFRAPLCLPSQFGPCLFDMSNAFQVHKEVNNTIGKVQLAVILLNIPSQQARVEGTGTLLSISFTVVGTAFRTIDIDETVSEIVGPVNSTSFPPVPYASVDGNFENRLPFLFSTNPSYAIVAPGSSISIDVTATQVWTVKDFTEGIGLTNGPVPQDTLVAFDPHDGILPFTSRITFTTSPTTPTGSYDIAIVSTSKVTNVRVQTTFTLTVATTVDISVSNVLAAPAVANPGQAVEITVTVGNDGDSAVNFQVNVHISTSTGSTRVGSSQVTGLFPGQTRQLSFSWSTGDFGPGVYSIRAEVPALQGEQDLSDNSLPGNSIRLNAPPSADFSFSPATPQAGSQISFDASLSSDSDGTTSTYSWDFGDGETATGRQVSHRYSSPGEFNVKLTIVDNDGAGKTITKKVTVTARVAGAPVLSLPTGLTIVGAAIIIIIVSTLFFLKARRKPSWQ